MKFKKPIPVRYNFPEISLIGRLYLVLVALLQRDLIIDGEIESISEGIVERILKNRNSRRRKVKKV